MHSEARGGAYLALHIGSYRKIGASDGRARLSCTAEGSAQTYSIYGLCGRGPAASALAVSTAPILSLSRGHWRERSASQQPQRDFVNVRIRPCWVAPKVRELGFRDRHCSVAYPPFTPPQGSAHPGIAGAAVPGRDAPGTTFEAAVTGVTFAVTDSACALNCRS